VIVAERCHPAGAGARPAAPVRGSNRYECGESTANLPTQVREEQVVRAYAAASVHRRGCRVRLELLGVRGSTAAPGADFVRYGGHTSCLAVGTGTGADPRLVLDAGTGIRALTARLGGRAFDGSILLSHLHWDHMQGLPFFAAGDRPDARADVYVPAQLGRSGHDLLAQAFSPPAFPIGTSGMQGRWAVHGLEAGSHRIEDYQIEAFDLAHKGGRTFGYRVSDGIATMAYLPDHAPDVGVSGQVLEALADVDVLLHDAQFVEAERRLAADYGHATIEDSIALAQRVSAKALVLIHHSPTRTDDDLDAIDTWARERADGLVLVTAREGDVLDVGPAGLVQFR
jgi:phosphoribosyl 1,2-cyclic phosphodiesterase